jgi:mannose-6-phosphate isomerase-like protein (cupin superfamily)
MLPGASSAAHLWQPVVRFVEKPADPQTLIVEGARWNMGQFVGTAGQFTQALERYAPNPAEATQALLSGAKTQWEFTQLAPWPSALASQSFDHAVLERAPSVVVPFTGHWQDLGDLDAWRAFTGLDIGDYTRQPARTDRPWGYFEHRHTGDNEVHKRLILYPDCRLSRQRHQKRAEHWRVLSGTAYIELDDRIQRLEINQQIAIPAGSWHRLANHHTDILIIEEIQIGICDETDIERAEDDYGRT